MEIKYRAEATAVGGREGHVTSSDGVLDMDLRLPGKDGETAATNPEQLFAAGYAACFCSALNRAALEMRHRIEGISVTVSVGLGQNDPKDYFLDVEITARIPGVEPELAREMVTAAENLCPYSKATRNNVNTEVKVETA
ncbi:MAG: Ohr family peroxiredoxin [Rikenellaceae bacterium]|nr:Ohr family peroxiredoxin [Rikenellaceae bacterium]